MHRTLTPAPPLLAVDFSTEMIALAALGARPSSGYDIVLTRAASEEMSVTASWNQIASWLKQIEDLHQAA